MPAVAATIGTAEVDVRAKLDNFDRDLKGAHDRLNSFDQAAGSSTQKVKEFERSSSLAGTALTALATALNKAGTGIAAFERADDKATEGLKKFIIGADESAKASKNAAAAATAHGAASEGAGKGIAHTALEIFKIAGYTRLAAAVAYEGVPAYRGISDAVGKFVGTITAGLPSTKQVGEAVSNLGIKATMTGATLTHLAPAATGVGTAIAATAPAFAKAGSEITKFAEGTGAAAVAYDKFKKVWAITDIVDLAHSFTAVAAAAYTVSPAFRTVANEEVKDNLKNLGSVLGGVATLTGTIGRVLTPMLNIFMKLALPITAAVLALKAFFDLFKLGQSKVEELNKELEKTGGVVTVDFLKHQTEAMEKFGIKAETTAESLKKFAAASQERLGGSALEQALKAEQKAGNAIGAAGLKALSTANTVEDRYRAMIAVITKAEEKGERLVALKIAETFLPPEMMAKLRLFPDFLQSAQEKADKLSKTSLIDEKNLVTAAALKVSIDESYKVLNEKWNLGVMPYLVQAGLALYGVWVKILEVVASIASAFGKLIDNTVAEVKAIASWVDPIMASFQILDRAVTKVALGIYQSFLTGFINPIKEAFAKIAEVVVTIAQFMYNAFMAGFITPIMEAFGKIGGFLKSIVNIPIKVDVPEDVAGPVTKSFEAAKKMAADMAAGIKKAIADAAHDQAQEDMAAKRAKESTEELEAAKRKLIIASADATSKDRAAAEAMAISGAVIKDTSKVIDENAKAWDRLIGHIKRRIAIQSAEAQAGQMGVAAQENLRVQLELEALAESRGIPITEARRKQIQALAYDAGQAAFALAKMKAESTIKTEFTQIKMGLTDQDVKIAQELQKIYGQAWPQQMNSAVAQNMRFVDTLKTIRDETVSVGTDFASSVVSNFRAGQRATDAWGNAAISMITKVEDLLLQMAVKALIQKIFGTITDSLFGGASAATTAGAALTTASTTAAAELVAAGETLAASMITGATAAAGIIAGAGAAAGGAGSAAAAIAPAALALLSLQHGGIVDGPTSAGDAIPILAHRGEEVVPQSDPRHVYNQNAQPDQQPTAAPTINVSFSAQGRFSTDEIQGHARTIANMVADQWTRNKGMRPTY